MGRTALDLLAKKSKGSQHGLQIDLSEIQPNSRKEMLPQNLEAFRSDFSEFDLNRADQEMKVKYVLDLSL